MNILKLFMPQPNVVRADHNNFAFFISSLGTFPPLKLFFSFMTSSVQLPVPTVNCFDIHSISMHFGVPVAT